jgi:hypothetical protein
MTLDDCRWRRLWSAGARKENLVMKHLTRFVSPGARMIGVTGFWAANAVAFENPDGERPQTRGASARNQTLR